VSEKIKVCGGHQHRLTPLRFTFAFPGCEYWCPYCGYRAGMFGAGRNADSTLELEGVAMADEACSQEYLHAVSARSCSKLLWEGKWIPPSDLPDSEKERMRGVIANWKYPLTNEAKP